MKNKKGVEIELKIFGKFQNYFSGEEIEHAWVPNLIDYNEKEIRDKIINPDDIVIKEEEIEILFDYPLSQTVLMKFHSPKGFSRIYLWKCIYDGYKKIYDEEEEDCGKVGFIEGTYNRKPSDGRYGIWGHVISDLCIEGIYNREGIIELVMGS